MLPGFSIHEIRDMRRINIKSLGDLFSFHAIRRQRSDCDYVIFIETSTAIPFASQCSRNLSPILWLGFPSVRGEHSIPNPGIRCPNLRFMLSSQNPSSAPISAIGEIGQPKTKRAKLSNPKNLGIKKLRLRSALFDYFDYRFQAERLKRPNPVRFVGSLSSDSCRAGMIFGSLKSNRGFSDVSDLVGAWIC